MQICWKTIGLSSVFAVAADWVGIQTTLHVSAMRMMSFDGEYECCVSCSRLTPREKEKTINEKCFNDVTGSLCPWTIYTWRTVTHTRSGHINWMVAGGCEERMYSEFSFFNFSWNAISNRAIRISQQKSYSKRYRWHRHTERESAYALIEWFDWIDLLPCQQRIAFFSLFQSTE